MEVNKMKVQTFLGTKATFGLVCFAFRTRFAVNDDENNKASVMC